MIRKISGKPESPSYIHLKRVSAYNKATSRHFRRNFLFCHNLSSFNYSESFRKTKTEQEKLKLNFKSQNNEIYSIYINLDELVEATGPDEIHYQMLKHLPDDSLETLLYIFRYISTTGKFPEDWQYATIIPIPKNSK